nr:hypothetical protein [Tanacetum cinerariifolium]
MAESSSHKSPSPEIKEEPNTLDKPKSPNPFLPATQYTREIRAKGTLKKSCPPLRWRLLMAQIMQCLGGKRGVLDQISNKDDTILYCLANGDSTAKADPRPSAPNDYIPLQQAYYSSGSFASHDLASCLPSELKELPSKVTKLSEEIKELKQYAKDIELELPKDLKEISSKLKTFTSTIFSLSSQVAELKSIQWELPADILDLPHLISSVQEMLKTLASLPGLLNKVTNTLNRFATVVEISSEPTTANVPSAGKVTALPTEGEKNTKDANTNLKNELVDLLGIDVITYKGKGLLGPKGRSGGMFKGGFWEKVRSCGSNGGREGFMFVIHGRGGSIARIGGGSLAKCLMKSNNGLGVGGFIVVGANRGEVKGGRVVFEVSKILLGVIPRDIIRKTGGKAFRVDGGAD